MVKSSASDAHRSNARGDEAEIAQASLQIAKQKNTRSIGLLSQRFQGQ
jgi:hypothetical protein